jgi:H+/Na+-translocating ferredoxin:NAD+ oxidoreductase subunit B
LSYKEFYRENNMENQIYRDLQKLLDTLPNGYPKTESGIEIDILKKIFTEEEAKITLQLKMKYEAPEVIAERIGMTPEDATKKLREMRDNGQILGITLGALNIYKLAPFVIGIYEYQINRMDKELAELTERYMGEGMGKDFHSIQPSIMKVIPIEKDIPSGSEIKPYESISNIIENAKAWAVADCICKKEKSLIGHKCDNPMEVCMGLAPVENYFDDYYWGRAISKEEAFEVLKISEEAGLVHMASNVKTGHYFICNCCGCCCGVLRGINEMDQLNAVAKSNYLAVVNEDLCTACEICLDRCQVRAIDIDDVAVINERCIGCGLCISTCPTEAIKLVKVSLEDQEYLPEDEKEWNIQRSEARGKGDEFKKLL